MSLTVIVAVLAVTTVASVLAARRAPAGSVRGHQQDRAPKSHQRHQPAVALPAPWVGSPARAVSRAVTGTFPRSVCATGRQVLTRVRVALADRSPWGLPPGLRAAGVACATRQAGRPPPVWLGWVARAGPARARGPAGRRRRRAWRCPRLAGCWPAGWPRVLIADVPVQLVAGAVPQAAGHALHRHGGLLSRHQGFGRAGRAGL
jgi:hypothetical protein